MPGPLDGYRIVDLTQMVSGPFATMLLADQGADVIKIEPLGLGDFIRQTGFRSDGIAAMFANLNRGKRSVTLDLSTADGRARLLDLAMGADVFVENFRPGVMDRLKLGYEQIRAVKADTIYVSISGYGDDGPYAARPVLDPIIQGLVGMVARQVNPQLPIPDVVRNIVADKSTALTVAQAITAALLVKERGGGGQRIRVPMLNSALYFFWPEGMMDHTWLDEGVSPGVAIADTMNLTEAADGHIIYYAATDTQRDGLFRAIGQAQLCGDERYRTSNLFGDPAALEAVVALVVESFRKLPAEEILKRLQAEDVPCGPVHALEDVHLDAQIIHNDALVEWEHPTAGRLRQPRPGAEFDGTPVQPRYMVAALGQHTDEVLASLSKTPDS
jgi:crotonobetainyl-CoA:carnitine CoA-transferase CaiB-like acyl-CoA transferase